MVQSDQKTCGKDGVHPQCAFVKLGGYAFSTFSIQWISFKGKKIQRCVLIKRAFQFNFVTA